ncbi:hypothetical protein ACIQGZ_13925 [Streptomyces sp. NPDC092296]|uniref:hypothetical protein n=1 Tax=Streptomyces sp. NPDC092296 TaxID=3366012 RepID=UPI003817BA2A
MPPASGRLLAGRYQLTDRSEDADAPVSCVALDTLSGLPVVLEATPLPELVSAEMLDDGLDTVYGLPPEEPEAPGGPRPPRTDALVVRAVRRAAEAADAVPAHPRLLQVFEVFEQDGYLWVVGEHLPGVPLARLLERGPLPPYRVAEIAGDLLGALHAVHAAGLMHGNITAETVLVCEDGTAMLGGLSTGAAQEALSEGTGADAAGGPDPGAEPGAGPDGTGWTLARLRARDTRAALTGPCAERWAPEQVGPVRDGQFPQPRSPQPRSPQPWSPQLGAPVGPAADCWAVGVLLFRALSGRAPYPEDDMAVLFDAVRAGRQASAGTCGMLRPLVEELLHPDPAARPRPAQLRERLVELLARAPEPYDPDAASVAALLPAVRPAAALERPARGGIGRRRGGAPVPHPDHPHGPPRHAGRRPGRLRGLLGPLLVGGVVLTVLLVLLVAALLTG